MGLIKLTVLDLRSNNNIACADFDVLEGIFGSNVVKRPETCDGEIPAVPGCVNNAGTWNGRISYLPITLSLSQDECRITGTSTIESPESCPSLCGFADTLNLTGNVSGNIFNFIIPQDPLVDCDTCDLICYGTDLVTLTVNGDTMFGYAEAEDCEFGAFFEIEIDLMRSSSSSSPKILEWEKNLRKSSMLGVKSRPHNNQSKTDK
jgi:hypothetical protein